MKAYQLSPVPQSGTGQLKEILLGSGCSLNSSVKKHVFQSETDRNCINITLAGSTIRESPANEKYCVMARSI